MPHRPYETRREYDENYIQNGLNNRLARRLYFPNLLLTPDLQSRAQRAMPFYVIRWNLNLASAPDAAAAGNREKWDCPHFGAGRRRFSLAGVPAFAGTTQPLPPSPGPTRLGRG